MKKHSKKLVCLVLCCVIAATFLPGMALATSAEDRPRSGNYNTLFYETDFSSEASIAGVFATEGNVSFVNGGMLIDGEGSVEQTYPFATTDNGKVLIDFYYSGNTNGESWQSQMGLTAPGEDRSNNNPKFVVGESGFQVHQEGTFGRGDHWNNFDGSSFPLGEFSDKYTLEILLVDGVVWYTVYNSAGQVFWQKPTGNELNIASYILYLTEENGTSQTLYTRYAIYTYGNIIPETTGPALVYSTDFSDATAVEGLALDGNVVFSDGGLLLDRDGSVMAGPYSRSDNMKFIIDFAYGGNTNGESWQSVMGFAMTDGERDNYIPKFVVGEGGFQVHQEGTFGRGDHWNNFDGASVPFGEFSDKYTLEIIVTEGVAWFAVYNSDGSLFWQKPSGNDVNLDEYLIHFTEEVGTGQTLLTKFEAYNYGSTPIDIVIVETEPDEPEEEVPPPPYEGPKSTDYKALVYSTNFADAASIDGYFELDGEISFTNGGMLIDKFGVALSQAYSRDDNRKFVIEFAYSGNTNGEGWQSLMGFAKPDGDRTNYDPKFVIGEGGFQVHQEGAFGRGDHWNNFDDASFPLGTFSGKYTLEIILEDKVAWFTVYDSTGGIFWQKQSGNGLNLSEYSIHLTEEIGMGQTLFTKFEVYEYGDSSSSTVTPSEPGTSTAPPANVSTPPATDNGAGDTTEPKEGGNTTLIIIIVIVAVIVIGVVVFILMKKKNAKDSKASKDSKDKKK